MIWLASLTIFLFSFSHHDVVEGKWSHNSSPWSNINQANSFMTCLVQNIASSPAFPLQEREDLESIVQTILAAITGLVSSHRGNTATQIQAMNMAFASSMAEIIIAEDAGNAQLVAAKTEALQEELTTCFKSVFGVVNRHFINEVQELIRMFAEEATSSETYNELDIGIDYGFGQTTGYGNAGSFSVSGTGKAGSLSTSTSTSTLKSTSTSTAAAAGSISAAGAAFGAGFGGFAGAGGLVNSFASALAGSSVFQSIFGSGISTNLAASIAISAVQSSLSSVVSVSNSVSVGISNSLQSAIFNLGAGASASAYASAIASSVVSGLSSAGVLSSSSASSIVSSLVSVLLQNASAIASQYGISVSAAASAAASSATSASTTTSTSTSTGAAAGSAAGAAGAAGAAFGAGFGGFAGAGGFSNNILPSLGGQNTFNNGISLPTDFTSLLSSPVGLNSQQSVSRIEGVISLLVQSFSSNGISINAVGESIRRIFGETSASGLSASEAALEALLEVIVALLQILSSASVGNVSFSSIPNIARSLGHYAILG